MVTNQRKEWADPHIVALVELDLQKMRLHVVLSREAITERLREMRDPSGIRTGLQQVQPRVG
jgi:hypothetical protein